MIINKRVVRSYHPYQLVHDANLFIYEKKTAAMTPLPPNNYINSISPQHRPQPHKQRKVAYPVSSSLPEAVR